MNYKNRENLIVQFLDGSYQESLEEFIPIKDNEKLNFIAQIQNILSWDKLAPRVYDVGIINNRECKITEIGNINFNEDLCKKYFFNDKFEFTKPYEETVRNIYFEYAKYGKIYYQNVKELKVKNGPRQSEDRISYMKLDKVDFKNKRVLDIGCAGGFFCRYADNAGASTVRGIDTEKTTYAAKHVCNLLNNFNIDFEVADLKYGYKTKKPFDIVFFLSMIFHIEIPQAVKDAKMVIFEDNAKETKNKTSLNKPWTNWFSKIEFVGQGKDHGNKSIYHLYK